MWITNVHGITRGRVIFLIFLCVYVFAHIRVCMYVYAGCSRECGRHARPQITCVKVCTVRNVGSKSGILSGVMVASRVDGVKTVARRVL